VPAPALGAIAPAVVAVPPIATGASASNAPVDAHASAAVARRVSALARPARPGVDMGFIASL
jgi:hypothetical protein